MNITLKTPDIARIDFRTLPLMREFEPISLDEMDAIRLMNRIDTKYLTNEAKLVGILEDAAARGYRIFVTEGKDHGSMGVSPYDSLYFDTGDLQMFRRHHDRRLTRQKVRTRIYLESQMAFLEIKRKNNHGRTKKDRIEIDPSLFDDFRGDEATCTYLASHSNYSRDIVMPALETSFDRITLVNRAKTERLTIDTSLFFRNRRSGNTAGLGNAVIIELKQSGHADSEMKNILLERRVKPIRVSKYCVGITLTDPSVKSNLFKSKIRSIEKTNFI